MPGSAVSIDEPADGSAEQLQLWVQETEEMLQQERTDEAEKQMNTYFEDNMMNGWRRAGA